MLNVTSVHKMLGVSGDKIEENVSEKKCQREKIISRALLMIKNTTIKPVLSGHPLFQRIGGDLEFCLST